MKSQATVKSKLPLFALALFALVFAADPAFAAGGLEKANTFVENAVAILVGMSLAVVTGAIMWAGYKFLFKHADIMEVGKILIGGLLIGGAQALAAYILA